MFLSPSAVFVEPIGAVRWVVAVVADKYRNHFYCRICATLINATQIERKLLNLIFVCESYLFVNLPEGVVGLVSFWRGRSVTCQCSILEFWIVLQIFILFGLSTSHCLNCEVYISPAGDGFAEQSSLEVAPVDCLSVKTFNKIRN